MLRRKPSNASEKDQGQVQKKKLSLQRSSSFKDFMKHKPTSPVATDKEFTLDETVVENVPVDEASHVKSGSKLGKKWRNVISRTMTRKTSKMVQKALAEEGGESGEDSSLSPVSGSDCLPDLTAGQRTSVCSTGSEDTMHSPISRQLSGCGDRQSLDSGYSQRDSMRLEESGLSYTGPFCGRALVHTDFIPSPYDVESLKLQKGDIIQMIEKPPVGTWTGKLNNKVGSFKFIYVNILPDESPPVRRKHRRSKTRSRAKDKPNTLEEVLESIGLTELSSLLSMHGFQTLDDFGGLKESHLNELNITDPEQRAKILNTTELLRDSEDESDPEEEQSSEKKGREPRDSGCFESSENLENGRETESPDQMAGEQNQESEEQKNQDTGGEEQEVKQTEQLGSVQEENQTEQLGSVQEENQTEQLGSVQEENQTEQLGSVQEENQTEQLGSVQEENQTEQLGSVQEENQTKQLGSVQEENQTEQLGSVQEENQTEQLGSVQEENQTEQLGSVQEENQTEQLGSVQELLQDLTVNEDL